MVTDGDQTKDEPFTPLARAAEKVKEKDVEVIAFSTKSEDEINVDDLRDIASGDGDENVFLVTPSDPAPAITTKITSKVKSLVTGKEKDTYEKGLFASFYSNGSSLI